MGEGAEGRDRESIIGYLKTLNIKTKCCAYKVNNEILGFFLDILKFLYTTVLYSIVP